MFFFHKYGIYVSVYMYILIHSRLVHFYHYDHHQNKRIIFILFYFFVRATHNAVGNQWSVGNRNKRPRILEIHLPYLFCLTHTTAKTVEIIHLWFSPGNASRQGRSAVWRIPSFALGERNIALIWRLILQWYCFPHRHPPYSVDNPSIS